MRERHFVHTNSRSKSRNKKPKKHSLPHLIAIANICSSILCVYVIMARGVFPTLSALSNSTLSGSEKYSNENFKVGKRFISTNKLKTIKTITPFEEKSRKILHLLNNNFCNTFFECKHSRDSWRFQNFDTFPNMFLARRNKNKPTTGRVR